MGEELAAFLTVSALLGVPLFGVAALAVWAEWVDASTGYADRMRRRTIWARVVLTMPLWCWWAIFPVLALGAVLVLAVGACALWHMASPGNPPTDGPGPSQGAYR